jgi:hypothetical protein
MTPQSRKVFKYQPLSDYLRKCGKDRVRLTREQIEKILGFGLPKSSVIYSWWSNTPEDGHYQGHAWTDAGYRVAHEGEAIVFIKK